MNIIKKIRFSPRKSLIFKSSIAILFICILFISVGFSSLSTALSVNGYASFKPVGMIRVTSIESNSLTDVDENSKSHTMDSITVSLDFTNTNGIAIYDVNITNFGQIDKVLTQIVDEFFSNEDVEYTIEGLAIDDVIKAGESVDFQIKFKYKDGVTNPEDTGLNSKIKFVFDDYIIDPVTTAFSHEGACTFNGSTGTITGEDCTEFHDKYYIDTGIPLYNMENYQKDYEVGFIIEEYVASNQEAGQAAFFNSKYEKESLKWPGLVFRKTTDNRGFELTQSINMGNKAAKTINCSIPCSVKIIRTDNVIYYSINEQELIQLQDMTNFNQQFDTTAWFGAAPDENGNAMRHLKATLSHMYVKLGTYQPNTYNITFNPNGGTVSETTRTVQAHTAIGNLPTPSNEGKLFQGWYTDLTFTTMITKNTIPTSDTTYYAKWSVNNVAKIGDTYYPSISDAINAIPADGVQQTITLLNDVNELITIPRGKNILLDLNNYIIRNNGASPTLKNEGTLKIINGRLINTSTNSVIDNNSPGVIEITGGVTIEATTKQALYNDGGTATISGNVYLSSSSTIRSTIQNLSNGRLTITGGTIISTGHSAINNASGTLVIGTSDGTVDTTTPVIQGKDNGILTTPTFSLYDGIVKGKSKAISDATKLTVIENNTEIKNDTETIDGVAYKVLYLIPSE